MIAGIYKLTSPSGKSYIGQSQRMKSRIRDYELGNCSGQTHLYHAILKYGFDNFEVEVLWKAKNVKRIGNISVLLDALEKGYIKRYNSIDEGYNLKAGGANGKYSKESRAKMSKSQKGRIISMRQRQLTSKTMMGVKKTIEHSRNISLGLKGKRASKSKIINMRNARINPLEQYSLDGVYIKTWNSAHEVHRDLGINRGNVCSASRGERLSAGGYKWIYKDINKNV